MTAATDRLRALLAAEGGNTSSPADLPPRRKAALPPPAIDTELWVKTADVADLATPPTKTKLWDHQVRAFNWALPKKAAFLDFGMGAGKSAIAVAIHEGRGHQRTLILCPKSVVNGWPRQFATHGKSDTLVYAASHGGVEKRVKEAQQAIDLARVTRRPVAIVVNYEAVQGAAMQHLFKTADFDFLIADECMPRETLISTANGDRNIDDLRVGDFVLGYDHATESVIETPVLNTFARRTREPLFSFSGAQATGNHPVWTENRGYVPSCNLVPYDIMWHIDRRGSADGKNVRWGVRVVRAGMEVGRPTQEVLRQILLGEVADVSPRVRGGDYEEALHAGVHRGDEGEAALNSPAPRCAGEAEAAPCRAGQSVPQPCCRREGTDGAAGARLGDAERRERQGADSPAATSCDPSWVGHRACHQDWDGRTYPLQDRHRRAVAEDRDRSGRTEPQFCTRESGRLPEGCVPDGARVDGSSFLESGDSERPGCGHGSGDDGREVFNIETGTGNYFANGILVHNCHKLKAHGGVISKTLHKLFRNRDIHKLFLSGSPLPHSPLDAFGQFRLLDEKVFGTVWTTFRLRYMIPDPIYPSSPSRFVDDPWANKDELAARMAPYMYHVGREVLDLPPAHHVVREVSLSPKARKVYDDVAKEFYAELDAGEITAANALTRLLRLSQIASGFVKQDDGEIVEIDDAKREMLAEILDELPPHEPVVVFARFTHDLDAIRAVAEKAGRRYGEISGRRNDLVESKLPPNVDVLGAQLQAGGTGTDFSRSAYGVYWSLGFSLGEYDQSLARLDRPQADGSKRTDPVIFTHLVVANTVEEKIYRALAERRDVVRAIIERMV